MKILFITPYLASPPQCGAQRRLEGLIRGLGVRHEVWLLSFATPNPIEHSATQAYCRQMFTVQHDVLKPGASRKRMLQLRSLASRYSFEQLLYQDDRLQVRLNQLIRENPFDVVQVEFAQMGSYNLPRYQGRNPVFVLDEHNIEYDIVRRTAHADGGVLRKAYSAANWRKVRNEELAAWRRFDGVALTSKRDEELLLEDVPSARTAVIPNAVDLETFTPNDTPVEPATLLFFGALDYHPNLEGMEYFLDEIMPGIQRRMPQVKLWVVGRNPPSTILTRQSEFIEFTGYVDDPRTYLDRASVVVVPLRIGGGTRFKIVEAMAKGKPIVSTSIGAEGLDAEHEKHLLLADTPEAFVESVCRLLEQPEFANTLGKAGRQFAEAHFGWEAVVQKLERFYDDLLAQRTIHAS